MRFATRNNYASVISLNSINRSITPNDVNTIIAVLGTIRGLLLNFDMPLNNAADRTYGVGTTADQIYSLFNLAGLI